MSKLHKKMVAMGDMKQYTYDDIVAECGEPAEVKSQEFTDIGVGTRAVWSDGRFSIGFNFGPDGKYCGIYHHRNWEPYIVMAIVTVVLIAAIIVIVKLSGTGTPSASAGAHQILFGGHTLEIFADRI